eukprot:2900112-Prymnesium_polylepis.1
MEARNGSSFPAAGRFRFRAAPGCSFVPVSEVGQNSALLERVASRGRETCFLTLPNPPLYSTALDGTRWYSMVLDGTRWHSIGTGVGRKVPRDRVVVLKR